MRVHVDSCPGIGTGVRMGGELVIERAGMQALVTELDQGQAVRVKM